MESRRVFFGAQLEDLNVCPAGGKWTRSLEGSQMATRAMIKTPVGLNKGMTNYPVIFRDYFRSHEIRIPELTRYPDQ